LAGSIELHLHCDTYFAGMRQISWDIPIPRDLLMKREHFSLTETRLVSAIGRLASGDGWSRQDDGHS
jgi:hypothetical protein